MVRPTKPSVALVSGFWGQNIGNAFFNIGGKWLLEQIFGQGKVDFIQDQPGYRTFHNAASGNPANDFGLIQYLDVEYVVLQGPLLTEHLVELWAPTFDALSKRGTKFLLISAAFFKFRDAEFSGVKKFFERYRPSLISTRDSRSYEILSSWDLGVPIYDGIDSAFYVPKVFSPFALTSDDYYAFNFDRYPEPTIRLGDDFGRSDICFEFDGVKWNLQTPKVASRLAHRSKVQAYVGHALDRRTLPAEINGKTIVRPEHRFNPHVTYKIYQHANAVASDEPWTYFTIYANSQLTLADRVHACVMTLAYGRPAMLFTPSARSTLFERVGCGQIRTRPMSVDLARLEEERQNELAWLRTHI